MASGIPIEVSGLTKRFGPVTAVEQLSFAVQPGRVTGFLGPNGAGKTTTLRVLLGLERPTEGTATFGGTRYGALEHPLQTVGAALEADFHPGRTARNHLAVYATASGIPKPRVDAVLEQVGLAEFGGRRVGGFSLGMRQRLALAYTLLGDPAVFVLDEPINGLDPEGIKWIRVFLRNLAAEGRTVLVSSHLLSEVQQSVDDVVIIAKGRLVKTGTLSSLELDAAPRTIVDSPDREALRAVLATAGLDFTEGRNGFIVDEPDPGRVGHAAFSGNVELSSLHRLKSGLEESFLTLVGEQDDAGTPPDSAPPVHSATPEGAPPPDSTPPDSAPPVGNTPDEGGAR
ncbi:ATP-binding cassette domain-containing protein [Agromyces sp. CFH 90414]|uniref:ATP-binding cassette domain-containing protein n=1 Tax=Agromyces agglutinans TaxID=2662258 RepID=A0A6I2FBI8_9MICO|nr:ATP-binding cassette domain-containing protein [Agromyces agglutinans]MRG59806.1 ATP-binding cassette domain-containing protein [Agromyces agglutinans]